MMLKLGVNRYFRLDVNTLTVAQRQTWYNRQILLLLNSARRVAKTDPTGDRRNTNESASTPRLGGAVALLLGLLLVGCDVCADDPVYIQDIAPTTNTLWVSNTFGVQRELGPNIDVNYVEIEQETNPPAVNRFLVFRDAGTNYEVESRRIGWEAGGITTNVFWTSDGTSIDHRSAEITKRLDAIDKRLRRLGYLCGTLLAVALIIAITLLVVIFHEDPDES